MRRSDGARRSTWALAALALLGGCVSAAPPPAQPAPIIPPPQPYYGTAGLDRVMGRDAATLIRLFGKPQADVVEGPARKLQFQSGICVLDAYLYPQGSRPPVVTHVDSRQPDGRPIDRASCVAAIARRSGGR